MSDSSSSSSSDTNLNAQYHQQWQSLYSLVTALKVSMRDDDRRVAFAMLQHPQNSQISTVPGRGFLVQRKHMFRGVTTTLAAHVWTQPVSKFPPAYRRVQYEGQATDTGPGGRTPSMMSSRRKPQQCKLSARDHGAIVHDELCSILRTLSDIFFQTSVTVTQPPALPQIDPCTVAILSTLVQMKWIPLMSEWSIWHAPWKVATSVDMIVYDMNYSHYVLVELKNGYEYEVYDEFPGDPLMQFPFQRWRDCPKNRHLAQLLITFAILQRSYNNAPAIARCVVLRRLAAHGCCTIVDLNDQLTSSMLNNIDLWLQSLANQK